VLTAVHRVAGVEIEHWRRLDDLMRVPADSNWHGHFQA